MAMISSDGRPICWVTGAFGFIGRRVSLALGRAGHRVLGVGHGSWPATEAAAWGLDSWVNGELNASNFHYLLEQGGLPSTIYHLAGGASVSAAIQNPLEDFRRNVIATAELLEWVRQDSRDTKLVVASSAAIYGNQHAGPIDENMLAQPFSVYGYNKAIMESLCHSYGFNYGVRCVVARIFSVYGSGLRKQLLWDLCTKLKLRPDVLKLAGTGEELRDWVHVDDTAQALTRLPELASREVPAINVGTGQGISVREVAATLCAAWSTDGASPQLQFDGSARPGDPVSLIADVRRLSNVGIQAERSFAVEAGNFVRWYKQLGARENRGQP
jgi:UDP-glucose 4-epimerase